MKLTIKKHRQEGDLSYTYSAFRNIIEEDGSISTFDTDELNVDMNHPLTIDCQPSYDGTVNLIINDDKNPPRIINSRFAKLENNRFKIISRNQKEQTNLYKRGQIDSQTRLFRTLNKIPRISLNKVTYFGQLKGGDYTFYVKFADNDYNKTDIVCESGVIEIYNGTILNPQTIVGTVSDEITDKSIVLNLENIDESFSKVYLYFVRTCGDSSGLKSESVYEIIKPYDITGSNMSICVNGFEDIHELSMDDLNIMYNTVSTVKTQAQVQNRLFFGNITSIVPKNVELQNLSYFIQVQLLQGSNIGCVNSDYTNTGNSLMQTEYYNPQNYYYKLGYWPDEIYRLGIVYIMNDDSLSPVYNLRGCLFDKVNDVNFIWNGKAEYDKLYKTDDLNNKVINYLPKSDFLNKNDFVNTYGVFKNPNETVDTKIITEREVKPWYYHMYIPEDVRLELYKQHVKGLFFVRQKRIPTILGQGLEMAINSNCYTPMLWNNTTYITESFVSKDNLLTTSLSSRILTSEDKQSSALLNLDSVLSPIQRSYYNGSEYILQDAGSTTLNKSGRHYSYQRDISELDNKDITSKLLYIPESTALKSIDDLGFSSMAGNAADVSQFEFFEKMMVGTYTKKNPKIIRGIYCPYLATNKKLKPGHIYNIKISNYDTTQLKDYFNIRGWDNAPFFAITNRYELSDLNTLDVFRGDCFVNTVTIRYNRNFSDPDVPIVDTIIDEKTWKNNYFGYSNAVFRNGKDVTDKQLNALEEISEAIKGSKGEKSSKNKVTKFYNINRADVNSVPMGIWVTFKCLSNRHLGIRSLDRHHPDEQVRFGNARTFYPVSSISTKSSYKIPESDLTMEGYSTTVGNRYNYIYADVPYTLEEFDNRIMFSNLQVNDDFKNAYRIFQGLSYQDIDRQYGAIVKLIPWGSDLLCIFEHGIGVVPINQKALLQTTTGQSIHMYGAGVLQQQVDVKSPDFGSMWPESIIRTPYGVYGVDTCAKKIWRMNSTGLEVLSDMKVQKFLNDHITLNESDKQPCIAKLNVKTHYNAFKGDVMFTFYDYKHNEEWNLCYNERIKLWITRYSWTPVYSENINNIFFSFDKKRAELLTNIYNVKYCDKGLKVNYLKQDKDLIHLTAELVGYDLADSFDLNIKQIVTSKLIDSVEIKGTIDASLIKVDKNKNYYDIYISLTGMEKVLGFIPLYLNIDVETTPKIQNSKLSKFNTTLTVLNDDNSNEFNDLLTNGFFVHGQAGNFDEINYKDATYENQILPTKWYNKQEPFEIEFVVNDVLGAHKIFDNLVIISNNVKPKEFEFEIIGDVFDFNKTGIFRSNVFNENEWDYVKSQTLDGTNFKVSQQFENCEIVWDTILNNYSLRLTQPAIDIKEKGRLFGNIQYKEDAWYLVIDPIKFKNKYLLNDKDEVISDKLTTARLRDKYMKIRIKYSGTDLAILTALVTTINLSYA